MHHAILTDGHSHRDAVLLRIRNGNNIGDAAQSNYGVLSEERHRTPDLISDHIHLNRFLARLLLALDKPEGPGDHITGLDDALFILSTSLEEHADSHDLPNVNIHAAAQYMIHAGELFFEACEKG